MQELDELDLVPLQRAIKIPNHQITEDFLEFKRLQNSIQNAASSKKTEDDRIQEYLQGCQQTLNHKIMLYGKALTPEKDLNTLNRSFLDCCKFYCEDPTQTAVEFLTKIFKFFALV